MNKENYFPSKLLLAGEYTILQGSYGLAIPWSANYCTWAYDPQAVPDELSRFFDFIKTHEKLSTCINSSRFRSELDNGLYLKSNIPYGYGLGSSGALCAAILNRFGTLDLKDIGTITDVLRALESYFHGQSSGLDPLVSFYNAAILKRQDQFEFQDLDISRFLFQYKIKLIDSRQERNTKSLVAIFKSNLTDPQYALHMREMSQYNESFINELLNISDNGLIEQWKNISKLSLTVFRKMIPETLIPFWTRGLTENAYYLKLCGAGGGGLFLVMVLDEVAFSKAIIEMKVHLFN